MASPRTRLGLIAAALVCSCAVAIAFPGVPFSAGQAEALSCPGPATEAALIAVARAQPSDERVSDWLTTCGVAFPLEWDTLQRLVSRGVSQKVAGAAVPGRYFYLLSHPSDERIASILANTPPGGIAAALSVDDREKMTATMALPNVAVIRTLFNRYLSARTLMTDPEDQRRAALLDALPSESLTKRFTVLAVNPLLVGGDVVTIMFVDASHLMLDVHVKDGVVSFLRRKSLSTEARDRLISYYRDILKDAAYLR